MMGSVFFQPVFSSENVNRYKCIPILTFDQPLWLNYLEIQQSETSNKDI